MFVTKSCHPEHTNLEINFGLGLPLELRGYGFGYKKGKFDYNYTNAYITSIIRTKKIKTLNDGIDRNC